MLSIYFEIGTGVSGFAGISLGIIEDYYSTNESCGYVSKSFSESCVDLRSETSGCS